MNRRFIFLYIAAITLTGVTLAQTPDYTKYAIRPEVTAIGNKLSPRSAIIPYSSKEEATSRPAESTLAIPITQWEQTSVPGGTRYTAQFKKHFSWDNRAVILRLEDVSSSFQLTINDSLAGYSQAGMGRTEFEITKLTKANYNTISITIFADGAAKKLEDGRKNKAPSIRAATILSQPTVRIHDIFTNATIDDQKGYLKIDIISESILLNPKEYTFSYELIDPKGKTISTNTRKLTTKKNSQDTTSFIVEINNPFRWNHETPNLYTLLITSHNDGRMAEAVAVSVGLRNIKYSQDVIFINKIPVKLHATKYTVSKNDELTAVKLRQLKDSGYNTIITDSTPQPDFLYSLCDAIGLYICSEADINNNSSQKDENIANSLQWLSAHTQRAANIYYSNHIHPSSIIYSLAEKSANGYCLYEAYNTIKNINRNAPIMFRDADGQWNTDLNTSIITIAPDTLNKAAQHNPISMSFNAASSVVTINNNLTQTPRDGTYKIIVKKDRKKIATYTDNFKLDRSSSIEIPIPEAASLIGLGTLEIEIQTPKLLQKTTEINNKSNNKIEKLLGETLKSTLGIGNKKVKVEELYDIILETLTL